MRIDELPIIMLRSLFLTIIIEVLIALILRIRDKKDLLNIVLVNVLTNPVVVVLPVFIYINFFGNSQRISLIILEILTLLIEGFVYSKLLNYKRINLYLLSLILNGSSYLFGELINYIF